MNKKTIFIMIALLSTQMTGCTTLKSYFFKPAEAASPELVMQYNFIQPRRLELPKTIVNKLNQESNQQNRYGYYSASGFRCRTLSLSSRQSACNIGGQWRALAPILNSALPL